MLCFSKCFLIADFPSLPVITNKETESLTCDVNLMWSARKDEGCPLTMYSIYYRQIQPQEREAPWFHVNVTNVLTTNLTLSLACGRQYVVEISAWNELGESSRSRPWVTKTLSGTVAVLQLFVLESKQGWGRENCRDKLSDQVRSAHKGCRLRKMCGFPLCCFE